MPAQYKKLVHDARTNFVLELTVLDGNDNPVDQSTNSYTLNLFETGKTVPAFTYSGISNGNVVTFDVDVETTALWDLGKYAYNVDYEEGSTGRIKRRMYGPLDIRSGTDV